MNMMRSTTLLTSLAAISLMTGVVSAQNVTKYIELSLLTAPTNSDVVAGDKFYMTLNYNTSPLTNTGEEDVDISISEAAINLIFDFINHLYTEEDDIAVNSPSLHFFDGELTGFHYRTVLDPENYTDNSFAIFYKDKSFEYSLDGSGEFYGAYTISDTNSVPEPNTVWLLSSLSLLVFLRKR